MKNTDSLVHLLIADIDNKSVLEVGCGSADFSISAATYANSVSCIDLDACRLGKLKENVHFQNMDASKMDFADQTFDTAVLYNAFFHIRSQWAEIEKECKRVLKENGTLYIVGTWKLDVNEMMKEFGEKAKWHDRFLIVQIKK